MLGPSGVLACGEALASQHGFDVVKRGIKERDRGPVRVSVEKVLVSAEVVLSGAKMIRD